MIQPRLSSARSNEAFRGAGVIEREDHPSAARFLLLRRFSRIAAATMCWMALLVGAVLIGALLATAIRFMQQ